MSQKKVIQTDKSFFITLRVKRGEKFFYISLRPEKLFFTLLQFGKF